MWSLFKALLFLVVLGAGLYAAYTVPVGGATIAQHASDIWSSREVQDKVRRVRDAAEDSLAQKLERALARNQQSTGEPEITDADRKHLESLLRQAK